MKRIFIPALVMMLALPEAMQAQTDNKTDKQKQETIVIKKKGDGGPQTVVEIKEGSVYVNGEEVSNTDAGTNRKIIIDGEGDMDERFFDNPASRKAMLGVYSAANKDNKGVMIQNVTPNSGAEKAGLKKGDVLTKVDGKPVNTPKELVEVIAEYEAGDNVMLTYTRGDKTQDVKATLSKPSSGLAFDFRGMDDIPNPFDKPFFENLRRDIFNAGPKLGISAEDRADEDGVYVADVLSGSPAAAAGLQDSDVIVKLDDKKVGSIEELQEILREVETDKKIPLQYTRNGKSYTTDISFAKPVRKKDL